MVPPDELFGVIPVWIAVFVLSAYGFGAAAFVLYFRVIRLVLLGRPTNRFDQPLRRIIGAIPLTLGQRRVLQSVSLRRDRAGLAHFFIFWGFLSFLLSYVVFIYGDLAWRPIRDALVEDSPDRPLSHRLLTDTGVQVFTSYIDVLAAIFLVVLAWAALRRWVARPDRLRFDLTKRWESAIILCLIALLMVLTLLTEALSHISQISRVGAS